MANFNQISPRRGQKNENQNKNPRRNQTTAPLPPPPTIPALENPVLSSVNPPEETQKTSAQAQKNAFKILKWPPKNQDSPKTKPRTRQGTKTNKKPEKKQQTNIEKPNQATITSMLQLKTSEVPSKETIKEIEPLKDQIQLKITLKPPTLVQLRGDNKIKPTLEQEKTRTTNHDLTTKPNLTVQARPVKKTNTEEKTKQPRKTKPRVVEASDIRLFIANKKLEREKKQRELFIVENSSPSNSIDSATPQCSSVPL